MSTPFGLQESLLCAFYTDAFSLPKINYRWSKHSISLSKKVRCIFLQKIFHSNIFVIVFKRGFNVLLCGLAEIRQSPFQPWEGSFFKLWLDLARWHVLSKTLTTNIKKNVRKSTYIYCCYYIYFNFCGGPWSCHNCSDCTVYQW